MRVAFVSTKNPSGEFSEEKKREDLQNLRVLSYLSATGRPPGLYGESPP